MSKRKQVVFDEQLLEKADQFLERLNGLGGKKVSFSALVDVALRERLSLRSCNQAVDNRKRGREWYALDHKRWAQQYGD